MHDSLPVERALDLTAEDEVRLLEGVVVGRDAHARLILDEQQSVVTRAEILVDHPLQKDALEPLQAERLALARRRNLADVEVAQQIAVEAVQIET